MVGAPVNQPKVIAFEGEFALCAGHAQELKTQALALKVGKRLRVMFSENNAGIDDSLMGGVIDSKYTGYDFVEQWKSYGWNVMTMANGHDYDQIVGALKAMDDVDPTDRRPIIVIGKTIKGYWPTASNGKIAGSTDQVVGYPSHPYAMKMNSDYFVTLAKTFEDKYGVEFQGIRNGAVTDTKERLVQFKTNMDVAMSVLEKNGLGDWLADRIVEIGDQVKDDFKLQHRRQAGSVPRRAPARREPSGRHADHQGEEPGVGRGEGSQDRAVPKAGEVAGARRGISEVIKWCNYVTGGRVATIAADLSESVNMEHGSLWGHYDPEKNPAGTRLKAAIQEAGNASTAIGIVGQNASLDPEKFAGMWAWSGTYGAFTPLMYLPARVWSQQNQDSKFRTGVLHILAGHSGPETAADARTHFGIFAPQVWKLFPRGQVINVSFWDYNDVAAGYFAAAEIAAREKKVGIIAIEVARPDFPVADRSKFADTDVRAAAKGLYVIRDFAPGKPKHGYVVAQGSSATFNLVQMLPKLEEAGINVKVISAISEELFDHQPEAYRNSVLPPEAVYDLMFISSGTRRMWPLRNVGPLTDEYSMTSDFAQPVADRRPRARRHRRSAPRSEVDSRRRDAVRERSQQAAGFDEVAARESCNEERKTKNE